MTGEDETLKGAGEGLYRLIRNAIVSFQIAPGQFLSENELAGRYNASRTPVRDALKQLEREGLVRISSRRKTMVAPLDLNAYRQAVVAREALEAAAAFEAALQFRRVGGRPLSENVAQQEAALRDNAVGRFFALDIAFHQKVFEIAALGDLTVIVASIRGHTDRMRNAHLTLLARYDHSSVVEQHRGVARAIEGGDPVRAEALMRQHVLSVMERVATLARERPDCFGDVSIEDIERLERCLGRRSDEGGPARPVERALITMKER